MTYTPNKGATVPQIVLAAAVANNGTFTVDYPSGFSQLSFNAGLSKYGASQMVVNQNDLYSEGASGFTLSFGASNITVTNTTGASLPAGTKIDMFLAQWPTGPVMSIDIPITLAGVSAADVVTNLRPGVAGYITDVQWLQGVPVTTGSKAATLTPKIGTTSLTGGAVALTSATCTPLGAVIDGTQVTANNRLEVESKLSVVASSVTAFAEGAGILRIKVQLDQP